jgi:hypothetical protein
MQLRHRTGFARTRHSDTFECWAVHCLVCRWACLHNSIFRFCRLVLPCASYATSRATPTALFIFSPATAELGLSLSRLVTMSTMNNVRVIGQQQLQVLSRKAFGRFLFSKSEATLLCALSPAIVLVCFNRERNKACWVFHTLVCQPALSPASTPHLQSRTTRIG